MSFGILYPGRVSFCATNPFRDFFRLLNTDFLVTAGISDWAIRFQTGYKVEYVVLLRTLWVENSSFMSYNIEEFI